MADSLKVLQRIKKMELDDLRRVLMNELSKREQVNKKLQELVAEYEREKAFVAENPLICDFGVYTERFLKKKQVLEKNIAELDIQIEALREQIGDIFKEQKTYNIVAERRKKEGRKKADMVEQKLLDEVGTNAYIKQHKSEN